MDKFTTIQSLLAKKAQAVEAEMTIEAALTADPNNAQLQHDYEVSTNCVDGINAELKTLGYCK